MRFVGFCRGFATKIIQEYFDDFIPRAIRIAKETNGESPRRPHNATDSFAYTIHPWIASLYVDCVPWDIQDGKGQLWHPPLPIPAYPFPGSPPVLDRKRVCSLACSLAPLACSLAAPQCPLAHSPTRPLAHSLNSLRPPRSPHPSLNPSAPIISSALLRSFAGLRPPPSLTPPPLLPPSLTPPSSLASLAPSAGCPSNPGLLKCPSADEVAAFDAAVLRGDLLWADSPFNVNPGIVGEPSFFEALFDIASALNERYNLTKTHRVWSNIDVPGFTRSSIPLLKKAGATALSVCANVGNQGGPGNGSVPNEMVRGLNATMWRWHDPASDEEILVLYHKAQRDTIKKIPLRSEFNTYGGYSRPDNILISPEGGTALASYIAADNTGTCNALGVRAWLCLCQLAMVRWLRKLPRYVQISRL